jgi:hypothetical protein
MLLNLKDSQIWKVTEAGSFKVTAFGGGKFAGTFSAKIGRVGDDLTTIVATAVVSAPSTSPARVTPAADRTGAVTGRESCVAKQLPNRRNGEAPATESP